MLVASRTFCVMYSPRPKDLSLPLRNTEEEGGFSKSVCGIGKWSLVHSHSPVWKGECAFLWVSFLWGGQV